MDFQAFLAGAIQAKEVFLINNSITIQLKPNWVNIIFVGICFLQPGVYAAGILALKEFTVDRIAMNDFKPAAFIQARCAVGTLTIGSQR